MDPALGDLSQLQCCNSTMVLSCERCVVYMCMHNTCLKYVLFNVLVKKTDVPLLPFNDEQEVFCKDTKMRYLLAAMQFRVPAHSNDYFYIPTAWSVKDLWDRAGILGQINPGEFSPYKRA